MARPQGPRCGSTYGQLDASVTPFGSSCFGSNPRGQVVVASRAVITPKWFPGASATTPQWSLKLTAPGCTLRLESGNFLVLCLCFTKFDVGFSLGSDFFLSLVCELT